MEIRQSLTPNINWDQGWSKLRGVFRELLNCPLFSKKCNIHGLHSIAYKIVLAGYKDRLYIELKETIANHLTEQTLAGLLEHFGYEFVGKLYQASANYLQSIECIGDVLIYLDRRIAQTNDLLSVRDLSIYIFREQIYQHRHVRYRLCEALLHMIKSERCGETIDAEAMQQSFEVLSTSLETTGRPEYEDAFEREFLEESASFFAFESCRLLTECKPSIYIKMAQSHVQREINRAKLYPFKDTEPRIIHLVKDELLKKPMEVLLKMANIEAAPMMISPTVDELGCLYEMFYRLNDAGATFQTIVRLVQNEVSRMLHNEMTNDLAVIYQTFSALDGNALAVIDGAVLEYLNENIGSSTPTKDSAVEERIAFVRQLLDIHDILIGLFHSNKPFEERILTCFQRLIQATSRLPEFLALFVDDLLKRKHRQTASGPNIENMLAKIVDLSCYVNQNDINDRYFPSIELGLAKRLLHNRSTSIEFEMAMIRKHKAQYGQLQTAYMERMVNEVSSSESSLVKILCPAFWPTQLFVTQLSSASIRLPAAQLQAFTELQQSYAAKYSRRRLTLQPHLGTAIISASFPSAELSTATSTTSSIHDRQYLLEVSTYQMCVLMLFNESHCMTYDEIQQATGMPENHLKQTLLALSTGDTSRRLLLRKNNTTDIGRSNEFCVNKGFSATKHLVKIRPMNIELDSLSKKKSLPQATIEDRKHELDAAIVRTMKASKEMTHALLINTVTEQLKNLFSPSSVEIKKRIDSLIEREYMARAFGEQKTYVYLN